MNNSGETNKKDIDYSLSSKFKDAGIRTAESISNELKENRGSLLDRELGRGKGEPQVIYKPNELHNNIVTETMKNIDGTQKEKPYRDHGGNGNKADASLASAVQEAIKPRTKDILRQLEEEEVLIKRRIVELKGIRSKGNLTSDQKSELSNLRDKLDQIRLSRAAIKNKYESQSEAKIQNEQSSNVMPEKITPQPAENKGVPDETLENIDAAEPVVDSNKEWQEDAVEKFERAGGKVLEAELEAVSPSAIINAETIHEQALEDREWAMDETISPNVKVEQPAIEEHRPLTPEQIAYKEQSIHGIFSVSPEALEGATEEQKAIVEKVTKTIQEKETALEERAEEVEVPKGKLERLSLWYNKLPLKVKLGLSAGLVATGFIVGSAAAPAIITAGVLMRTLGAGGMTYALREKFEKRAREKNGGEITFNDALLSATSAIAISAFVSVALPNIVREYAFNPIVEKIGEIHDFYSGSSLSHAPIVPQAAPTEYFATACPGDSRWSLAARALTDGPYKEHFATMSAGQKTYIIDALKDKLTEGMSPADANTLNVGDKISLHGTIDDPAFMDKVFAHAQGLTPDQQAHILHHPIAAPGAHIAAEAPTPARTMSADEFMKQGAHVGSSSQAMSPEIIAHAAQTESATVHHGLLNNVETPHEATPRAPSHEAVLVNGTEALGYANERVHDEINKLFGSRGFFGFGAEDGIKNANWLDFANRPVDQVYHALHHPIERGNFLAEARRFGMGNNEAISKMQNLIFEEVKRTGIKWNNGETVNQFLHRAAEIKSPTTESVFTEQTPPLVDHPTSREVFVEKVKHGFNSDSPLGGN